MSMDESLYAAPESALDRPVTGQARPLEAAMAGEWDFEIREVMSEAWDLVSGSKGPIWLGLLIVFGASIVVQFASTVLLGASGDSGASVVFAILGFVASLLTNVLSMVISAGAYLFALKRAAGDETAAFSDVVSGFNQFIPLALLSIVMFLMLLGGFLLFVLPGIYLMMGYLLIWTLRMDRGLGIWESLETSRKTIHHHWFKVFGLMFVTGVAAFLGTMLTLGIGIVWAYPFIFLVVGVLHYKAFGYAGGV